MLPITSFDPTASLAGGKIPLGAADAGARILFYNESFYNIKIDFLNGNVDLLHAWEARWWRLDGDTKELDWTIDSTLSAAGSPISLVMGSLYGANEELPGTYPVSLFRQANIGNTVTTAVGSANSVFNDNNGAGQTVVESTELNSPASNVFIDNQGNAYFAQYAAAAYTKLFQVIAGASAGNPSIKMLAAGLLAEILGDLQVDGNLKFNTNGDGIYFQESAGGSLNLALYYDNLEAINLIAGRASQGAHLNFKNSAGQLFQILGGSTAQGCPVWNSPAVQIPTNNATISLTGANIRCNPAAAVTGLVMQAGTITGEEIRVANISSTGGNTMTFAATGSNVGGGNTVTINAGHEIILTWDNTSGQWITCKSA